MSSKSVLIIGAGPAGLVAAKTLLCNNTPGRFNVTIFESADRVGGMWRAKKGEEGVKCSPEMRTNLSRFTVAFSDLSWNSVDLSDPQNEQQQAAPPPMFPHAWQVGRYLQTYADKFIPSDVIHFNRTVTRAEPTYQLPRRWRVSWFDTASQIAEHHLFDYLIIASGFYDEPRHRLSSSGPEHIKMEHSSSFRDVSLLTSRAGNIVVVGGGISGSEAASTAAFQISNARYAPGKPKPVWADCKVVHVFNRPFYALPRYFAQDPYDPAIQDFKLTPKFLPLDLTLYSLGRREKGPISAPIGPMPPERAENAHRFLRTATGESQRGLGYPELVYTAEQQHYPAFTGITDTYTEFVRSGIIIPRRGYGHLVRSQGADAQVNVEVQREGIWSFDNEQDASEIIDNVVAVIGATGFQSKLEYLPTQTRRVLQYDRNCQQVPFLLSRGSVFHPDIPNLAFVGFYQGPFWSVMEMQARLIARKWGNPDQDESGPYYSEDGVKQMEKIREGINARRNDISQFWMGDVAGFVEEFARELGIEREDGPFGEQQGPCFGARYPARPGEPAKIVQEVRTVLDESETKFRFVAAAAFRAMQGVWDLERKIDSRSAASPGGSLKGIARFHPRIPTSPEFAGEYLYIEEGTFTMDNGYSFPATRRYVYRYNEVKDKISAWFVKDDGETVERFFNQMEFQEPTDKTKGWLAKGSHWCDPDTYKSSSEFRFHGAELESFGITYDVTGPKKDYTMETWYRRPAPLPRA